MNIKDFDQFRTCCLAYLITPELEFSALLVGGLDQNLHVVSPIQLLGQNNLASSIDLIIINL